MTAAITSFRGPWGFLSNFSGVDICYEDLWYPSVEHAYQASKTLLRVLRIPFTATAPGGMLTCREAKKAGQNLCLRDDWNQVRLEIMNQLVWMKFTQRPDLEELLLKTGTVALIERNTWGDTFWGEVDGKGFNHLGRILMRTRRLLKADERDYKPLEYSE